MRSDAYLRASAKSASANTMFGDFPPSSSSTGRDRAREGHVPYQGMTHKGRDASGSTEVTNGSAAAGRRFRHLHVEELGRVIARDVALLLRREADQYVV